MYSQVTTAYRLRNNCAKIVNPGLQYLTDGNLRALKALTRKSYSVFLKQMEEVYDLTKDQETYANLMKNIEKGTPILRLLNELPE
ncbi:MAG: hypothetical protein ACOX0A_06090 [Thermoguttaceae bacterium]